MEQALARQRECLKKLKESAAQKEATLQEKTRQVEAAQAALGVRVQEAVQEAVRKLQEDQRKGPSESPTRRVKQARLWCHSD